MTNPTNDLEKLRDVLRGAGIQLGELTFLAGSTLVPIRAPGGDKAIELWKKLRPLVPQTGRWPVIVGDGDEARRLLETLAEADTARGMRMEPSAATDADLDEELDALADELAASGDEADDDALNDDALNDDVLEDDELPVFEWPSAPPPESYTVPFDILSREPHEEVLLVLVPTERAWEVPVHLRFGGFNESPPPEEHAERLRRWHDAYGAEVVCMTSSVIELAVARPPQTKDAARALAAEQASYCPDIIDQGVGTEEHLAMTLWRAPSWFFWWD